MAKQKAKEEKHAADEQKRSEKNVQKQRDAAICKARIVLTKASVMHSRLRDCVNNTKWSHVPEFLQTQIQESYQGFQSYIDVANLVISTKGQGDIELPDPKDARNLLGDGPILCYLMFFWTSLAYSSAVQPSMYADKPLPRVASCMHILTRRMLTAFEVLQAECA